jgi:molecular chaperone GrpE (heat shock protein)
MKFCLIVKKSELAKELKNSSYKLIDNGRKQRYTRKTWIQTQNTESSEQDNQENVSQQQSAEELLAEEKDRYIRLYAEFENYKKNS